MSTPEAPPRFTRLLAIALAGLLLVELGSRAFVYVWSGGESFSSLFKYEWSPYGLVRNNPGLTSPDFQINANGFRDVRDYTKDKPDRTLRVMLFGGSVLYSGLGGPRVLHEEPVPSSRETIAQFLARRLEADPALDDLDVEVLNTAVNFNRIAEVSSAYVAEWIFWDPDVVIVLGSANNVNAAVPSGRAIRERRHNLQAPHPWAQEYQRLVVERSLSSLVENALRVAEEHLACVALARKALTTAIDRVWQAVRARRLDPRADVALFATEGLATREEIDLYFRDYAGYVEAILGAASVHDQEVAFFWEYFVANLDGLKPFSEREKWIYPGVKRPASGRDYNFYMRDRLAELLERRGARLIDPLPELRQSDETLFIDYLHYTVRGNEFMADVIYDRMRDVFHARAERIRRSAGRADARQPRADVRQQAAEGLRTEPRE